MLAGAALWVLSVSFEALNVIINVQTPPLTMLFAESLLYKEGECSAGFRHRESDLAEDR